MTDIVLPGHHAVGRGRFRGPGVAATRVSYCRVDAGGVPADWVEATTATTDQLTLVCFVGGAEPVTSVDAARPAAGWLAVATGARVLIVGCRSGLELPSSAAVEDGVAAYAWLVGEGCDRALTEFVADRADRGSLARAVLRAARNVGLPVPRGGVRSMTSIEGTVLSYIPPDRLGTMWVTD